jgi:hypothetical protein
LYQLYLLLHMVVPVMDSYGGTYMARHCPNETADLKRFYPNSTLVTGHAQGSDVSRRKEKMSSERPVTQDFLPAPPRH